MDSILSAAGTPEPMATGALIKETSTATFQADVIDASQQQPVLVDFWAPWCEPCKQLGPALDKAVTAARGKVKLVKINVDENQELAGQMGVRSIPAVFAFSAGQPVDGFMGALPDSEINRFIDKITGDSNGAPGAEGDFESQVKTALETADQALEQGEPEQATQIYTMILQQLPDNMDALMGLANVHLKSGQLTEARELLDALSEQAQDSARFAGMQKAIALAEEAEKLGDAGELEARIEVDPADHQARLDLAMVLNHREDRVGAAQQLIASIKLDRDWNEGAAKVKLLEFFEAWGPADPATAKGRRMLSTVLFA